MKAINKAFYESAVQAHTYTHPNDKVHDQHVFHTKCQSDCCLHIVNHSNSFFLSLAVTFALISLYSASSFHPHDGHHRKLNHHFTHTHSLVLSFHSFSQKGSDCYYSYIQITYILKLLLLLLLLLLCMTKIQNDSTHTLTRTKHMYTKQQASKYCDKGAIN